VDSGSISLLALLHGALAALCIYHALLYKRDTRAATGWIMFCLFVPYAGPISYYLFGINRVRSRAQEFRRRLFQVGRESGRYRVPHTADLGHGLITVGQRVTGRAPSRGNSIRVLHNGEQTYPAMLASIAGATQRVLLSTYILKTDQTGQVFADALADAAARGVDVLVLVDGVGELYAWPRASKMLRQRGVTTARFLPPSLLPPSIHLNLRNHRKLLIIDHEVAYAGGMNISNDHTSVDGEPRSVTDVHFALRGPVVTDLAAVFDMDWRFSNSTTAMPADAHAPAPTGEAACRLIPDGPDENLDSLALTLLGVVNAAERTVDVMTPYFLPSRELIAAFKTAALRGVRVRIVLPAKNNLFFVHWANRNVLAELLEWGVEVYYQPAPFSHSKLLCVDENYSLIGSANIDPRSLRLNFELGIEVFYPAVNGELCAHIDAVVRRSSPVTIEQLDRRSIPVRLRDSLSSLFSPYL
jgi:cardiolipin synthase